MDSQARAEDLAATILSATASPQIAAACSAIDNFLRRHPSDQIRPFFSLALPALLCRLFGFDDSAPTAWIDRASADPDLAPRIFDLLSPGGILLSSIAAVDRHGLVRFVFPNERLPEWIRWAIQSDRSVSALADLCPLLKGRVTEDIPTASTSGRLELNLFEYYMMWFAYYPVCKGNSESAIDGQTLRKSSRNRFRLERWTSSFPVLSNTGRRPGQKPEYSLYLRLLYVYLKAFVPKDGLGSCQPYRSSLLHYSMSSHDTAFLQAEFLVHTFVHFWMVDNDFSPFPVNVARSYGLLLPNRAMLCENPPTPGLGDVLKLLVNFLNCNSVESGGGNAQTMPEKSPSRKESIDDVRSRKLMLSSSSLVGSWTSVIQRPLYRFIVRSFLYCPIAASIKNASQVFDLWTTYLEPWKLSLQDFAVFEQPELQNLTSTKKEISRKNNTQEREHHKEYQYSNIWQNYVLSNYMFYNSLVVHFLGFAHKFLHANADLVIQMVSKVLNILTSSKELLELLQKVDIAYHSKPAGPSSYSSNDAYKYLPSIREQLLDWEDGLCENDTDGSFLHENWSHEMKLFSDTEDGAHQLLQLFVLRAEHETRLASGDVSNNIQALDSIRTQMNLLLGGSSVTFQSSASGPVHDHHERSEVFTPKHPGVGQRTWADVKYKGDWMRRPISEYEIAWFARLLIRLSDWLNVSLSLDRPIDDSKGPIILDLSCDEVQHVGGMKDALQMVLTVVGSWFAVLGLAVLRFMRTHRMRINLRPLASKKFVTLLAFYIVVLLLKRILYAAFAISHSP